MYSLLQLPLSPVEAGLSLLHLTIFSIIASLIQLDVTVLSSAPCYIGPPKADWAAPARAKWQATPARPPKKPHPMATAAARRAQMRELDTTPPTHLLNPGGQNVADQSSTPAKRMLCSTALSAQHTPAKRLHTMHASDTRGQRWQQEVVHEGDNGLEGAAREDYYPMGSQPCLHPQYESRLRAGPVPYGIGVYQQGVSGTVPHKAAMRRLGTGTTTSQVLNAARPQAQRQPVRREVGLESGSTGALASLQLRTPLRPNSAGSALRGYVPPEHRSVRPHMSVVPTWNGLMLLSGSMRTVCCALP